MPDARFHFYESHGTRLDKSFNLLHGCSALFVCALTFLSGVVAVDVESRVSTEGAFDLRPDRAELFILVVRTCKARVEPSQRRCRAQVDVGGRLRPRIPLARRASPPIRWNREGAVADDRGSCRYIPRSINFVSLGRLLLLEESRPTAPTETL